MKEIVGVKLSVEAAEVQSKGAKEAVKYVVAAGTPYLKRLLDTIVECFEAEGKKHVAKIEKELEEGEKK